MHCVALQEYSKLQAEERAKAAAQAAADNAPISAKIESTGGPYTYKQLTAEKEFRPDDVDPVRTGLLLARLNFLI